MIHRNGWQIDYTTEIWQPLCFCKFLFLRLWQSLKKIVIQLFRLDEKRLSHEASSFNFSLPVTILFSLVRTVHAKKGRIVHYFSFSLKFVHSYLKQHLNVYITIGDLYPATVYCFCENEAIKLYAYLKIRRGRPRKRRWSNSCFKGRHEKEIRFRKILFPWINKSFCQVMEPSVCVTIVQNS